MVYFTETTEDKNKVHFLRALEDECILNGNGRSPCEFGVKLSVKEGVALGMRSMPGNPDNWHNLGEVIIQLDIPDERTLETCIVDRGYKARRTRRNSNPEINAKSWHQSNTARDDRTKQRIRAKGRSNED